MFQALFPLTKIVSQGWEKSGIWGPANESDMTEQLNWTELNTKAELWGCHNIIKFSRFQVTSIHMWNFK